MRTRLENLWHGVPFTAVLTAQFNIQCWFFLVLSPFSFSALIYQLLFQLNMFFYFLFQIPLLYVRNNLFAIWHPGRPFLFFICGFSFQNDFLHIFDWLVTINTIKQFLHLGNEGKLLQMVILDFFLLLKFSLYLCAPFLFANYRSRVILYVWIFYKLQCCQLHLHAKGAIRA